MSIDSGVVTCVSPNIENITFLNGKIVLFDEKIPTYNTKLCIYSSIQNHFRPKQQYQLHSILVKRSILEVFSCSLKLATSNSPIDVPQILIRYTSYDFLSPIVWEWAL